MNVKKKIAALALAATHTAGGAGAAYAASFGNCLNGASSVEVLQVKYDGAAWKYSRAGKTLMHKVATNGKVTGSVWDTPLDWSSSQTTIFNWGHDR